MSYVHYLAYDAYHDMPAPSTLALEAPAQTSVLLTPVMTSAPAPSGTAAASVTYVPSTG